MRQIQRNNDFLSFLSNPAYSKNIFDFDNISNVIQNSLLFGIIGADVIKKQLIGSSYNDHGIISSIVLLMHYYENGTIYSLNPLKRAIIELAAIIIYDHTCKYKSLDDSNCRENYPRWSKNPLSILFRVVDDIQEWDRVYFEFKPYSNIRICPVCKMPMLKKEIDFVDWPVMVNEFTKYKHICACNKNEIKNRMRVNFDYDYGSYKQQMSFNNQKINYIIN